MYVARRVQVVVRRLSSFLYGVDSFLMRCVGQSNALANGWGGVAGRRFLQSRDGKTVPVPVPVSS